jgi:hypothetical protein
MAYGWSHSGCFGHSEAASPDASPKFHVERNRCKSTLHLFEVFQMISLLARSCISVHVPGGCAVYSYFARSQITIGSPCIVVQNSFISGTSAGSSEYGSVLRVATGSSLCLTDTALRACSAGNISHRGMAATLLLARRRLHRSGVAFVSAHALIPVPPYIFQVARKTNICLIQGLLMH